MSEKRSQNPSQPKLSRRRFVALVASSAAALAAAPAAALAQAVKPAAPAKKPGAVTLSSATAKELARQKKGVADTLKVIREYPLPAGSDVAYLFRPLRRPTTRVR